MSIVQDIFNCATRVVVVNGCAGSRKTDNAVKVALQYLEIEKTVMMLTKVTSVTHEITTRLTKYGNITFSKQGNHYFSKRLEVANMDAMIHDQLMRHGIDVTNTRGESHKWKCEMLYDIISNNIHISNTQRDTTLYTKQGESVDIVIVDEFQDFEERTVNLIFNYIKHNPNMKLIVLGDIMQTIFQIGLMHPMNAVKSIFPKEHTVIMIETCWRCPKAHIDFVNELHGDHLKQYGLPVMRHANTDSINKPILFAHMGISNNIGSMILACTVRKAIKALLKNDTSIQPGDIAIIMRIANQNKVFAQMEPMLNSLYKRLGYTHAHVGCKVFETKREMAHIAIDWNIAEHKTVMLSVHGDKGKGHKVVFVLGYAERSIPLAHHLFKDEELLDQSLSYVALTRSLKHLFIGFPHTCPSRYLLERWSTVMHKQIGICAWSPATYENSFHNAVCPALAHIAPSENISMSMQTYIKEPIFRPHKFIHVVTDVAMQSFEHHLDILPEWESICKVKQTTFGKFAQAPHSIRTDDVKMCIYGEMAELMFEREYKRAVGAFSEMKTTFKQLFVDSDKVMYTDDEDVLCFACDLKLNTRLLAKIKLTRDLLQSFEDTRLSEKLRSFFDALVETPRYVLPRIFDSHIFKESVAVFFDDSVQLTNLATNHVWNLALARSIMNSRIRRPALSVLIDWLHEPLVQLKHNIQQFTSLHIGRKLSFNGLHNFTISIKTAKHISDMGFGPDVACVNAGIIGIEDFSSKHCVYEMKCPVNRVEISCKWIIQALLYACIGGVCNNSKNTFAICDMAKGVLTRYTFEKIPRETVLRKTLETLSFAPELIELFEPLLCPKLKVSMQNNVGTMN